MNLNVRFGEMGENESVEFKADEEKRKEASNASKNVVNRRRNWNTNVNEFIIWLQVSFSALFRLLWIFFVHNLCACVMLERCKVN